jgi:CRISPR-associated protein Csd1
MLPQLVDYEKREAVKDLPEHQLPQDYRWRQVMGLIDLDDQGSLVSFVTLATKEGRRRVGKEMPVPDRIRTSDTDFKPLLLADSAEFVLGVMPAEPDKQGRTQGRTQRFIALVQECADETKEPTVAAALHFLKAGSWKAPEDFAAGDLVTLRVNGEYLIELPSVRRFWADYLARARDTEAGRRAKRAGRTPAATQAPDKGQCLVCGEKDQPIARLHEVKIKGIPGGQLSGTALVSFNAPAFESYSLTQSYNAPICHGCAETYAKGLNRLLRDEDTSLPVEQVAYIFWTREPQGFSVARLLGNPDPQQVKALLESPRKARPAAPVKASAFYALALSASGGRAVVRDWIESTVGDARRHLARYFAMQRIVDWDGSERNPLGLYALAASTVAAARDLPPTTPRALLRTALAGGPLPMWLLFQTVRRNRAEQRLTRPRAALIKMVWLSNHDTQKEDKMVQLDMDNRDPAYLCGRLLAVVESAQRAALPGLEDTVTDRFYGTASSAPASVFPRLLRGVRPHLSKLRRDRPAACYALEARLEEINSGLKNFPRVLTLEKQGLFALGFYHQRATDRAAATAHRQADQSAAGPEQG